MFCHLSAGVLLHLAGTRIILGCCALLLSYGGTTFFEVDCGEDSRLHQDDLFAFVGGGYCFVAHLPVDVYFAFGELS